MDPQPYCLLLQRLPAEIILDIFENLPYSDLRTRVPSVCKAFRSLLQKPNEHSASKIDRTLFRDSPKLYPPGKIPCTLHPALDLLNYSYTTSIDDVTIRTLQSTIRTLRRRPRVSKLIDLALCRENASSPSASRAVFHSADWSPDVEVEGTGEGGAVTILDVMNGVVRGVADVWPKNSTWGCMWDGIRRAEIEDGVLRLYDEYPD